MQRSTTAARPAPIIRRPATTFCPAITFSNGRSGCRRHGLTLIELVVVMLVLVALAGILIPMLPGMIGQAHTSSSAANAQELAKAVQLYEARYFRYPGGLDNLATGSSTIATFVPGNAVSTQLAVGTLSADEIAALDTAGVRDVNQLVEPGSVATWSATAAPYATLPPTLMVLAASTNVALVGVDAKATMGLPALGRFVVFGLGNYSTMQGKVIDSAPIHFSDDAEGNAPAKIYSRLGLMFQVADDTGSAMRRAKFVGPIAFHDDGLANRDAHVHEYHENK